MIEPLMWGTVLGVLWSAIAVIVFGGPRAKVPVLIWYLGVLIYLALWPVMLILSAIANRKKN